MKTLSFYMQRHIQQSQFSLWSLYGFLLFVRVSLHSLKNRNSGDLDYLKV